MKWYKYDIYATFYPTQMMNAGIFGGGFNPGLLNPYANPNMAAMFGLDPGAMLQNQQAALQASLQQAARAGNQQSLH